MKQTKNGNGDNNEQLIGLSVSTMDFWNVHAKVYRPVELNPGIFMDDNNLWSQDLAYQVSRSGRDEEESRYSDFKIHRTQREI